MKNGLYNADHFLLKKIRGFLKYLSLNKNPVIIKNKGM